MKTRGSNREMSSMSSSCNYLLITRIGKIGGGVCGNAEVVMTVIEIMMMRW